MFWGVTLESGKRYSQNVPESFHISMACLAPLRGESMPVNKEVYVMLEYGETEYALCVLEYGRVMQVNLDMIFDCGEVVTYFLNGEGVVHLTGYAVTGADDDVATLDKSDDSPSAPVQEEMEEAAKDTLLQGAAPIECSLKVFNKPVEAEVQQVEPVKSADLSHIPGAVSIPPAVKVVSSIVSSTPIVQTGKSLFRNMSVEDLEVPKKTVVLNADTSQDEIATKALPDDESISHCVVVKDDSTCPPTTGNENVSSHKCDTQVTSVKSAYETKNETTSDNQEGFEPKADLSLPFVFNHSNFYSKKRKLECVAPNKENFPSVTQRNTEKQQINTELNPTRTRTRYQIRRAKKKLRNLHHKREVKKPRKDTDSYEMSKSAEELVPKNSNCTVSENNFVEESVISCGGAIAIGAELTSRDQTMAAQVDDSVTFDSRKCSAVLTEKVFESKGSGDGKMNEKTQVCSSEDMEMTCVASIYQLNQDVTNDFHHNANKSTVEILTVENNYLRKESKEKIADVGTLTPKKTAESMAESPKNVQNNQDENNGTDSVGVYGKDSSFSECDIMNYEPQETKTENFTVISDYQNVSSSAVKETEDRHQGKSQDVTKSKKCSTLREPDTRTRTRYQIRRAKKKLRNLHHKREVKKPRKDTDSYEMSKSAEELVPKNSNCTVSENNFVEESVPSQVLPMTSVSSFAQEMPLSCDDANFPATGSKSETCGVSERQSAIQGGNGTLPLLQYNESDTDDQLLPLGSLPSSTEIEEMENFRRATADSSNTSNLLINETIGNQLQALEDSGELSENNGRFSSWISALKEAGTAIFLSDSDDDENNGIDIRRSLCERIQRNSNSISSQMSHKPSSSKKLSSTDFNKQISLVNSTQSPFTAECPLEAAISVFLSYRDENNDENNRIDIRRRLCEWIQRNRNFISSQMYHKRSSSKKLSSTDFNKLISLVNSTQSPFITEAVTSVSSVARQGSDMVPSKNLIENVKSSASEEMEHLFSVSSDSESLDLHGDVAGIKNNDERMVQNGSDVQVTRSQIHEDPSKQSVLAKEVAIKKEHRVTIVDIFEPVTKAAHHEKCLWKIKSLQEQKVVISFVRDTLFVSITFLEDPDSQYIKKLSSITLESKFRAATTDVGKLSHSIFYKLLREVNLEEEYPDTTCMLALLECLSVPAERAMMLCKDVDLICINHEIYVQNETELCVEVESIAARTLHRLRFPMDIATYPYEKILPTVEHLLGTIHSEFILNAMVAVEPGIRYVWKMVQAVDNYLDSLIE